MLQRIDVISLFPEMFSALQYGITGRAIRNGLIDLEIINPREFTHDKHRTVDDLPYGGGPGMIMKVEPIVKALESLPSSDNKKVILLSPSGIPFNQKKAKELSALSHIVLICGRYEGIDERIVHFIDEAISIGDYVLTGGELPAMVVIDAVSRLIPGVLGDIDSTIEESFSDNLLEYPQYTRPRDFRMYSVPEILTSGNHERIKRWRRAMAIRKTLIIRPDLLKEDELSDEDKKLLEEFKDE